MSDKIENLDGLGAVDLFDTHSLASIAISLKRIADMLASGTLTEGGDVEQAPGDSLSGPTGNAGDAQ